MIKGAVEEDLPMIDLTPEGKKLELKLARVARRMINKLDLSEEEKELRKEEWFNYLLEYENLYRSYNKLFKKYKLPTPNPT